MVLSAPGGSVRWRCRNSPESHHLVGDGGLTATSVVKATDTFPRFYVADVPTGRRGIGVWAADGLSSSTASATASNPDDPLNMNVNTTAGGIVVGIGVVDAGTTATWTGLTENFGGTIETGIVVFSGASATASTAWSAA